MGSHATPGERSPTMTVALLTARPGVRDRTLTYGSWTPRIPKQTVCCFNSTAEDGTHRTGRRTTRSFWCRRGFRRTRVTSGWWIWPAETRNFLLRRARRKLLTVALLSAWMVRAFITTRTSIPSSFGFFYSILYFIIPTDI